MLGLLGVIAGSPRGDEMYQYDRPEGEHQACQAKGEYVDQIAGQHLVHIKEISEKAGLSNNT